MSEQALLFEEYTPGKSGDLWNTVMCGDALALLKFLPDNSVDALVCDPPAGIFFMNKAFDSNRGGRTQWIAWLADILRECLRVVKPGGHAFVWALPRTSHWTMTALEDAGWALRDKVYYCFGCLSEDTEILTSEGWIQYQNCVEGSLAMCYNVDTKTLGYEPIQEVFTYGYDDTAYHVHSDYTDQIVSRNHRCLVERGGTYVFNEAESLEHYVRVPILEDLPGLFEALPVYGQTGDREAGDLLTTMQRQICADETCGVAQPSYTRKHEISSSLYETMRDMQSAFCVPDEVAGTQKQILHTVQSQAFKRDNEEQGEEKARPSLSALQQAVQADESGCAGQSAILLEQMLRYVASEQRGDTSAYEGDSQLWAGGLDSGKPQDVPGTYERCEQSCVEGRGNVLQNTWQLYQREICAVPAGVSTDGSQRRICDGTPFIGGKSYRTDVVENGSRTSHQSRSDGQSFGESAIVRDQLGTQTVRASRYTRSDLAVVSPIHYQGVVWCVRVPSGAFVARRNGKIFITGNSGFPKSLNVGEGRGTGLKPAVEEWILARKSLSEKTVIANVLRWGTGALNISATRVGDVCRENHSANNNPGGTSLQLSVTGMPQNVEGTQAQGRWPAHLLLSHSTLCTEAGCDASCPIRLLDEQSGLTKSGSAGFHGRKEGIPVYGINDTYHPSATLLAGGIEYGDAGGASRYFQQFPPEETVAVPLFYAAKTSRKERNTGMHALPEQQVDTARATDAPGANNPRNRGGAIQHNHHPTVKNLKLCRFLVKLITPPGGTVLDCFAGSGSTLVAAVHEGFSCIGMELESDYAEIAAQRLAHALKEHADGA